MKKLELDKKQMRIAMGVVSAVIVFILIAFFYKPLSLRISSMNKELAAIERELVAARSIAKTQADLGRKGYLLARREIPLAIDEVTKGLANVKTPSISTNSDRWQIDRFPLRLNQKQV